MTLAQLRQWAATSMPASPFITTPPVAAQVAGYTDLLFIDDFVGNALSPKWTTVPWFAQKAPPAGSVRVANSVLRLGGVGSGEIDISSAAAQNVAPYYFGHVFGGGGYFEAKLRFNPADSTDATASHPAFWSMAIEHVFGAKDSGAAQHWPGQVDHYDHFAEVDFLEAWVPVGQSYVGKTSYLCGMHDWSGVYGPYTNRASAFFSPVGKVDWSAWHTYGCLWVPQADSATPGYVQYFFDDHAGPSTYWLGPIGDPPPPTSGTTYTYAVLDQQHLALRLSTDAAWPMWVDWVRVWGNRP